MEVEVISFRMALFLYFLAIVSIPWFVAFLIVEKWHERHRDKEMYDKTPSGLF